MKVRVVPPQKKQKKARDIEGTLAIVALLLGIYLSHSLRVKLDLQGPFWTYVFVGLCGGLAVLIVFGGYRLVKKLLGIDRKISSDEA